MNIKERLDALLKSTTVHFFEGLESIETRSKGFYMEVQSKTAGEDYAFLMNNRRMRKFLGERVARKLKSVKFYLPNEDYEDTLEVSRNDIADDTTGKYNTEARAMGESVKLMDDDQLVRLINEGSTALAIDGQYFFDTDHAYGDDNKIQSNAFSLALNAANYTKVLAALKNLRDNSGRSVNRGTNVKFKLVVSPALEATARAIVETDRLAGGEYNANFKTAEVEVMDLATDTAWYIFNIGGTADNKPFIRQEREFEPLTDTQGGDTDFHNRIFYFGTFWRGAFGYGLYQFAIRGNA